VTSGEYCRSRPDRSIRRCTGWTGRAGSLLVEEKRENQRAKFYRITALGKKQLASDYERWGRMVAHRGIMSARGTKYESAMDHANMGRKADFVRGTREPSRMAVADRVARGAACRARRAAMREFGNVPLIADVTR